MHFNVNTLLCSIWANRFTLISTRAKVNAPYTALDQGSKVIPLGCRNESEDMCYICRDRVSKTIPPQFNLVRPKDALKCQYVLISRKADPSSFACCYLAISFPAKLPFISNNHCKPDNKRGNALVIPGQPAIYS